MNRLFYLATVAAFALVPLSAKSADLKPLVVKAPELDFNLSGWYVGLGTAAATDKGSISDPALGTTGSITTAGAAAEVIAGYHYGNAAKFIDAEFAASYWNLGGVQNQVVVGAVNPVATMDSRVSARATLKIGGTQTYANLLAALSTFGGGLGSPLGVLTPPTTGPSSMPYAAIDLKASRVDSALAGLGMALATTNNWEVRPGIGLGNYATIINPTTGKPTGCMMDTSIHYFPAGKGFALGGNGNSNLGREFEARLAMVC
jgi:hypothetical protein